MGHLTVNRHGTQKRWVNSTELRAVYRPTDERESSVDDGGGGWNARSWEEFNPLTSLEQTAFCHGAINNIIIVSTWRQFVRFTSLLIFTLYLYTLSQVKKKHNFYTSGITCFL